MITVDCEREIPATPAKVWDVVAGHLDRSLDKLAGLFPGQ